MERSELISKLCKEAAETTPDIYDKILGAAKTEGLLSGGTGAGLSGGAGSGTARSAGGNIVKSAAGAAVKSRFAAVVATVVASVVAVTAVGVPLALNANSGLGGGSEIEAPDVNGGTESPSTPSTPDTPDTPDTPNVPDTPVTPVDPNGVKSIAIQHKNGNGNYLWNETDVRAGEYKLYGAQLEITYNDNTVKSEPLTYDMFGNGVDFSLGNHEITVEYGGKTAEFSIFVASIYMNIEVFGSDYKFNGSLGPVVYNSAYPYELDLRGLTIEGEFNIQYFGSTYYCYYGETQVDNRFVKDFDGSKRGLQTFAITAGNISSNPRTIREVNAFGYETYDITETVFLSEVIISNANNEIVYSTEVSPEKPYINLHNIPDRYRYYEPDYSVEFVFKICDLFEYSGGGDSITVAQNISFFDYSGYEITGDTNLWSVLNSGERLIKLSTGWETKEVAYTVYDSDYTNIRYCYVIGEDIISYELSDSVTLDTIKQDLMKHSLYVEYFENVNGVYVEIVPITEDMLDFSNVDVNSFDLQYGFINYKDKSVAVNITKPYSVAGAQILYNLTSTNGVNFILSETTVNDLGQCMYDECKEIVLYDNGVAMLKHTGNGIGNVLIGYKLEGNNLTLLRNGAATSFLTVDLSSKTFNEINLNSVTSGMSYTNYKFTHLYFTGYSTGWTGTFTAYTGSTGFANSYYVDVHLTGWASTTNSDGYSYQIAGVDYVATWTYGWYNNKSAFVLRFADKDWWFEIGTADSSGNYSLTLINTVSAS